MLCLYVLRYSIFVILKSAHASLAGQAAAQKVRACIQPLCSCSLLNTRNSTTNAAAAGGAQRWRGGLESHAVHVRRGGGQPPVILEGGQSLVMLKGREESHSVHVSERFTES